MKLILIQFIDKWLKMRFSEIKESVVISLESMRSNKLRSFLASLGVVIGISFVIIMGWILSGLDKAVEDTFNIVGIDMLYVDKWDWAGGKNWKDIQARKNITIEQAEEFMLRIKSAELTIPIARGFGGVVKYRGEQFSGMQIQGLTADYGLTPGGSIDKGRFFTQFEDNQSENVCVLGTIPNNTMFADSNGVGKTIKINGKNFLVIGVLTKQGTMMMDFVDNVIYIPINSFFGLFGNANRSVSIAVKAGSVDNLDEVRAETEGVMRTVRNIAPGKDNDFSINETKAFEANFAIIRTSVWGIGIGMTFLSFLVGIIGIMNIMFVSVTERTKEIGIRKAIGAKKRDILMQFIIEAATLSFVGAIISFVFCSLLVFVAATYLPMWIEELSFLSPVIPYNLLFIASIVSIFVGLLAGLIPAIRASNLDPIDALRYE